MWNVGKAFGVMCISYINNAYARCCSVLKSCSVQNRVQVRHNIHTIENNLQD
jgi:hypothetical protein